MCHHALSMKLLLFYESFEELVERLLLDFFKYLFLIDVSIEANLFVSDFIFFNCSNYFKKMQNFQSFSNSSQLNS